MKPAACLNKISVAVPEHDIHQKFVDFAPLLLADEHNRHLFRRMAGRCQIAHRYSHLKPHPDPDRLDAEDLYRMDVFPDTQTRMRLYRKYAFQLAQKALDPLHPAALKDKISHLIVTTCTGFYAPGLDMEIINHYGLKPSVERSIIGFMGCYAGINALKMARHIVRSDESACVLILNLELCTLHLQKTQSLQELLSFLIFADGCSASLVSAEPAGIELQSFHSTVMPDSQDQITWAIGGNGFDMNLSGQVPLTIAAGLPQALPEILHGNAVDQIRHWAIHPGGRTVLDAVRDGIGLAEESLRSSREVLHQFGNMSSATIMFVLEKIMQKTPGAGCAMAFGPGLAVESMRFQGAR